MASRSHLRAMRSYLPRHCSRNAIQQSPLCTRSLSQPHVSSSPIASLSPATRSFRQYATQSRPLSAAAEAGAKERAAEAVHDNATPFAEQYAAQGATEALFKECASQADYTVPQAFQRDGEVPKTADGEDIGEGTGWWYENLGLQATFSTWCHITFLHMWLLMTRLRYFPDQYANIWMQHLTDHFFFEAEHRMNIFHGVATRTLRNTYLKDIHNQWRGVLGAYDEGLIKGDAVLAAAVWRNIFKGNDDVDWRNVALVVSFIRRALKGLDGASDKTIVGAMVRFGNPMSEAAIVAKPSRGLEAPLTKEDQASLEDILSGGDGSNSATVAGKASK